MKIAEVKSGLAGKKSSNSMLSAALEDFFKPSSGDVESGNVLSDWLAAVKTLFFSSFHLKTSEKKLIFNKNEENLREIRKCSKRKQLSGEFFN